MRYSAEVLARVQHPERVGALPRGAADVGSGEAGSLDTGTLTRIQVRVARGRVKTARFKVFGCSAAIASASLVTEWLEDASIEEGRGLDAARVIEALQLPDERVHVAALAVEAARAAIEDWVSKSEERMAKSEWR